MTRFLFGLAGCDEAFRVGPTIRVLSAAGHEVRLAWSAAAEEFDQAMALGLPELPCRLADAAEQHSPLTRTALLAEQAIEDAEVAVSIGHSPFALALAEVARDRGRRVLRLDAGLRAGGAHERARRLADHAADYHCVSTRPALHALLHEGCFANHIRLVGSLLGEALAQRPAPDRPVEHAYLWLAIEHATSPQQCAGGIERLLALVEQGAAAVGLRVHAVPTILRAAVRDAGLAREQLFLGDDGAAGQLAAAQNASLLLTDSLGHQELAATLGIPCVALAASASGWRHDLHQLGHTHLAAGSTAIPTAIAAAMASAQPEPLPSAAAAEAVCEAIDGWLHPIDPYVQPDADLPSDADGSGRTFDEAEIANVTAVLRSGTLNSTRGTWVSRFEREFAAWLGSRHAIACASGSAAMHCALAALGLEAGDEVITTPITDMGALTPIFYEGAVPVFADVDPRTLNVTAETIAAQLTERTRAIVVTHLFGRPCELGPIFELACAHELPVIQDAAQAFGATLAGAKIGSQGLLTAFSLQQGKHITTGEGGIVCTDDDDLARRLFLFVNKAWGYGDATPDHYFPALNYRMTELQGAVACGQLPKLDGVVAARHDIAGELRDQLQDLVGIACPDDPPQGTHSYWKFAFRVDARLVPGGAVALGGRMRQQGIACAPRYVQKPAFECELFREWLRSPVSALPLGHNPRGARSGPLFDRRDYPGAIAGLEQVVVLPINERYQLPHVMAVADAIRTAHRELVDG